MTETTPSLVKGYLEKADEKLAAAQVLFEAEKYDDAVSRAYYAAFHAATACLLTEGQEPKTHHGVLTLFSMLFVKTGKIDKTYGRHLSNLKDDRENGDYDVFSTIDEAVAQNAIREAREFVEAVKKYLNQTYPTP